MSDRTRINTELYDEAKAAYKAAAEDALSAWHEQLDAVSEGEDAGLAWDSQQYQEWIAKVQKLTRQADLLDNIKNERYLEMGRRYERMIESLQDEMMYVREDTHCDIFGY